jgi:hypothetical protein
MRDLVPPRLSWGPGGLAYDRWGAMIKQIGFEKQ